MDFDLSEEQAAFREAARSFAVERMAPEAAAWDENNIFPVAVLREAAALGFAGLYCDPAHGGTGLGRVDTAVVLEELSSACPSTAAYISIHNMASWMIDSFGDDDQRARWLPGLTAMDLFASYCLSEPGAGSDAAA
ncbi:MAG: acyl-CoA dehydrogenase family protein, partial [Alphaproteobacteria bacterium]|nr:acyl-CoA dehydrogenase family protein [Alphaproteobacteria bacterium]